MKVLVASASRYGSTDEIGQAIGDVLAEAGHDVDVCPAETVDAVDPYDAVVIGSGIYAGHWIRHAKDLVRDHADALRDRQVWLFSSGPIGDPPKPDEDPADVADMIEDCGATGHRLFAGKLDRSVLRFADRAIVTALRAHEGDYRDWDDIRAWAEEIAAALGGTDVDGEDT